MRILWTAGISKLLRGGGTIQSIFHNIVSLSNLLRAWKEFKKGKSSKIDVSLFEMHLEDNLFELHYELVEKKYIPLPYEAFFVYDPKRRHIHKAHIRDRVVHQAIYRVLYLIFDKHFIFDSYSSRLEKGTHKGSKRLFISLRKMSKNWRKPVFALKCDVRKFFDSIDHQILFKLIKKKVQDIETLALIWQVIDSFTTSSKVNISSDNRECFLGLPLGNVTSQLFANIYMNELDQFVKHKLKTKFYLRYADDFIILQNNRIILEENLKQMCEFLEKELKLQLHPGKVFIKKLNQGIDFVGYVILPNTTVLRTKTKSRILRKLKKAKYEMDCGEITKEKFEQILASYLGVLKHCKNKEVKRKIKKINI